MGSMRPAQTLFYDDVESFEHARANVLLGELLVQKVCDVRWMWTEENLLGEEPGTNWTQLGKRSCTNDHSWCLGDSAAEQVLRPVVSIAKEPAAAVLRYFEERASAMEL